MDSISYWKEKGKQSEISLELAGCKKCNTCHMWMDKEYIGAEGHCSDCGKKREPFLLSD